jgi:urea transport system permease protein
MSMTALARPSLLRPVLRATPRAGWWGIAVSSLVAFALVPVLHLVVPAGSPLHVSDFVVAVAGKIACYATVAVALDLIWGYAGILSLGHGLFFALGGYAFGMYLMRAIGHDGVYQSDLPDFMVFLDWKRYPWYWHGTQHAAWALALVVLAPGLLALVFGWFAFRSRIRGVYFSIITQALTYAAMLLFFRNDTGFGGNNGFTDFKRIFGFPIAAPGTRVVLFASSVLLLIATLVLCRWLVSSPFGRVLRAVRDGESRLRCLGYDPLWYKLLVWTLSAILCGIAGALYVPQVGIINPSEMSPANSIEIAIWVAVGGRGTLLGAALGAVLVNLAKSWFTKAIPELWLFFLGFLFVAVTRFLPDGVVGAFRRLRPRRPAPAAQPAPRERSAEEVVA